VVESPSDEDVDNVEPAVRARGKGKGVAQIPLLTRRAHHSSKKKKLRVNMKPVLDRLDAHGEILCSLQNEVSSIFVSQSTGAKQIGAMKAELQSLKGELGSIKQLVQHLLVFVREQLPIPAPLAPTSAVPKSSSGPSGPIDAEDEVRPPGPRTEEETRPSGPIGAEDAGPLGPKVVEGQPAQAASGPSGPSVEQPGPPRPVVDEQGRVEAPAEEVVPPEPPSSPLQTPAPPSPPSSITAPPAPATFKQPLPKHIFSPTPFPTTTSSSPASSTFIPPPPSEAPPASSSSARASSSSPSSSGPSIPPPSTAYSFLHPPTPPSFFTIIPEGAQLEGPFIQDIKDEFKVVILRSVLLVGTYIHRTGSSSHVPKKRKISSNLATSSEPHFPPLWFSLTVENRRRSIYCEFLQKCTFATIFGLPHLNLTDHLNIVLPLSSLSKAEQSKIFSMTKAKSEKQWARGHQSLYRQFISASSARFPPRDHPLPLSEWFVIHHKNTWGPFIQKEIKLIRYFQMFNDYSYLHNLPEVQLGQFRQAISLLASDTAHTTSIQVDFATLEIPDVVLLPPLHSLVMESAVGPIIFKRFARVMGCISVQKGNSLAFHIFVYQEYHQGHIKSDVLAPLLSECEWLSPSDWERFYPLTAQQLLDLNASLARSNQPPLSAAHFLDLNSIHLVRDPFDMWVERYKVFISMKMELKHR
ncbi:hypothetical protein Taro_046893, partial [Colocasia esculenta]|nr:hypothetical protein [Colocasia esculenta]